MSQSRAPNSIVYLALGSNLGRRRAQMIAAVDALNRHPEIAVAGVSRLYETTPVGGPTDQPDYLNAAIALETVLSPESLLHFTQSIEFELDRKRTVPDAPRTIDIDILLYEPHVSARDGSTDPILPHPRIHQRLFVLQPLSDVAGSTRHPTLNRTVTELRDVLPQTERVRVVEDAAWWTHVVTAARPPTEERATE